MDDIILDQDRRKKSISNYSCATHDTHEFPQFPTSHSPGSSSPGSSRCSSNFPLLDCVGLGRVYWHSPARHCCAWNGFFSSNAKYHSIISSIPAAASNHWKVITCFLPPSSPPDHLPLQPPSSCLPRLPDGSYCKHGLKWTQSGVNMLPVDFNSKTSITRSCARVAAPLSVSTKLLGRIKHLRKNINE